MIHPDTYIKKTDKGFGVFARRRFQRGEILWIIDEADAKIPLVQYRQLSEFERRKLNIYCYLDEQDRVIIPWDEGKYVNHSCDPNSAGLLQFDNISVALRDIGSDEEIVEDYYGYYGHFETFECRCGAPNCRKRIQEHDSYQPALRLDLAEMAPLINTLPQALLAVNSEENWTLRAALQTSSVTVPTLGGSNR